MSGRVENDDINVADIEPVSFAPTSVGRVRDTIVVTDSVIGQVKRVWLVGTET